MTPDRRQHERRTFDLGHPVGDPSIKYDRRRTEERRQEGLASALPNWSGQDMLLLAALWQTRERVAA